MINKYVLDSILNNISIPENWEITELKQNNKSIVIKFEPKEEVFSPKF